MKEIDEESNEILNEYNEYKKNKEMNEKNKNDEDNENDEDDENEIIFTDLDPNIFKENNNIFPEMKTENKKRLPMLSEIISISEDKGDIKPPIFTHELTTKNNYDDVDLEFFSNIVDTFLIETKQLINLIKNNNETLLEKITKYKIPYMNYFYNLTFISKELLIIDSIIHFKYSKNNHNIDEYNKFKNQFYSEKIYDNIDNYINELKTDNSPFYDFMNEKQTNILKKHIIELSKEEKRMIEYFDNLDFIPGLIPITICLNCFEMNIIDTKKSFQKMVDSNYKEKLLMMTYLNNLSKIDILTSFINNLCFSFSKDDLLNKKENDSSNWKKIKQHYIRYCPYSREIIDKGMNKFLKYVNIAYASINKAKSNANKYLMFTSFGLHGSIFFFDTEGALSESKRYLINPETKALLTICNMIDNPIFLDFTKIVLPYVKYDDTFYIKRTQKEIDIQLIEELCKLTKNFDPLNEEENIKIKKIFMGENNDNKYIKNDLPLIKEKNDKSRTDDNYVKIKVYCYKKLEPNIDKKTEFEINNNQDNKENKDIPKCELKRKTIIFHVHGGGFVAMSPNSHENYILKWAKELKVPIFSIDYRLSPEVAFPKALDDVYQSYLWVLNYSKIIFNIEFDEIIFAGDSAGGNLVCALTYLCILNKIKLPKVLFMFYPALKIDIKTIVPSYLISTTDIILEYHLLKYCIEAYTGNCSDNNDKDKNDKVVVTDTRNKFLSPFFMDDNILKYLPTIRIFGGSCDVLRDDTFYFMERLINLNKDIFFYEFKYLPHGYLNFDFKIIFPELSLITDIINKEIEAFIE